MSNALHEVGFESLALIEGGKPNVWLREVISTVSADCQSRPGDTKSRKVGIELEFKPILDPDGYPIGNSMEIVITSKLPAYRSKPYSVGARKRGNKSTFVFNEESLDDVNQGSLGFPDEDDE